MQNIRRTTLRMQCALQIDVVGEVANMKKGQNMQSGRAGMGSHKHAVSGHAPKSPRFKFMRQLEANKEQ
jgi:hypothetical protein